MRRPAPRLARSTASRPTTTATGRTSPAPVAQCRRRSLRISVLLGPTASAKHRRVGEAPRAREPAPSLFPSFPRIPHFREARAAGPADRKAMNSTLSTRQLRLVVLLVLVVVAAGGYMVVTHKSTTTQATTTPVTTPVTTPATTTPTPSKTQTHPATPSKVNTHGLPVSVVRA